MRVTFQWVLTCDPKDDLDRYKSLDVRIKASSFVIIFNSFFVGRNRNHKTIQGSLFVAVGLNTEMAILSFLYGKI
jgi:hypothetical protein